MIVVTFLLLYCSIQLSTLHSLTACSSFPEYQYYALKELYDNTHGEYWTWQNTTTSTIWNFTNPLVNPCNEGWQGLNCTSTCHIQGIELPGYNLTGALSPSLGSLNTIRNLTLRDNHIIGSLPVSLKNWTHIDYVDIEKNALSGTFPEWITDYWLTIRSLTLSYNHLHGSIPNTIHHLQHLTLLNLRNNSFTGTLPITMTSMPSLQYLYLKYNSFNGTLPSDIGNLSHLILVDFSYNNFHGTIPTSITSLTHIEVFYAYFNHLTGSIPVLLDRMTTLAQFSVNNNLLTGVMPVIGNLTNLILFRADVNTLTGTIPNCFQQLSKLTIFNMTTNKLSGPLPSSLQMAYRLLSFDVSSNRLTGNVNDIFTNSTLLVQLILYNNRFTGNVYHLVNPTTQTRLTTIDISQNLFTGTLSSSLFMLSNLTLFAAAKNCFTGTIPHETCLTNNTLQTLVLDGLHTQPSCQRRIFPDIRTYLITTPIHGTVPPCLFTDMYRLRLLHLSGNSLVGTLPSTPLSPLLNTLSLAHNRFTGTIPLSTIQARAWNVLDLSFNKFHGFLSTEMHSFSTSNDTFHVENNRLSGLIPTQLKELVNINILSGNMFECDIKHTQLPSHDPHAVSYECASQSTDNAIYTWITFFLLLLWIYKFDGYLIRLILRDRSFEEMLSRIHVEMMQWWVVYTTFTPRNRNMFEFGLMMVEIRYWALRITVLMTVVLIPVYGILTWLYGTYSKQYAWTISIAFLSGFKPAIVMMILLVLILVALYSPTNRFLLINFFRVGKRVKKQLKLTLQFYCSQFDTVNNSKDGDSDNDEEQARKTVTSVKREDMVLVKRMLDDMEREEQQEVETEKELLHRSIGRFSKRESKRQTSVRFATAATEKSDTGEIERPKSSNPHPTSTRLVRDRKGSNVTVVVRDSRTTSQFIQISMLERPSYVIEPIKFSIRDAKTFYRWYALIGALSIVNVTLVIIVNMAYVASISDRNMNSYTKETLSFVVSVFKLIWNGTIMDKMYYYIHAQLMKIKDATKQEMLSKRSLLLPLMLWLSIFNNIIVPFIAVAFISPNCFYYAIYPANNVKSVIAFNGCTETIRQSGTSYETSLNCHSGSLPYTIVYSPPFAYSYQCTSSLLSSFASIFLYRYILGGAIVPIGMMIMKVFQEYVLLKCGWESEWFHLISLVIPSELRPLQRPPEELQMKDNTENACNIDNPLSTGIDTEEQQTQSQSQSQSEDQVRVNPTTLKLKDLNKMLGLSADSELSFGLYSSMIMFATDIAILLTFGTMFPPLVVIACFTIYIRTYYMQVTLGRIIHLANTQSSLRKVVDALNDECSGISKLLMSCLLSLPLLLSCLWSWFLFDIWGDQTGYSPAYYIILCLPLIPLIFLPIVFPLIQIYVIDYFCPSKHDWDHVAMRGKAPKIVSTTTVSNNNTNGSIELNVITNK